MPKNLGSLTTCALGLTSIPQLHHYSLSNIFEKQSICIYKGHQGDVTHVQKGQIQKHYALKLSSMIQSTKPKNSRFC